VGDPFVHEDSGIDPTPPALGIRIIDVLVIQTSISEFDSIRTASSPVNVHPVAKERVIDVACNTDKILAIANLLPLILPRWSSTSEAALPGPQRCGRPRFSEVRRFP